MSLVEWFPYVSNASNAPKFQVQQPILVMLLNTWTRLHHDSSECYKPFTKQHSLKSQSTWTLHCTAARTSDLSVSTLSLQSKIHCRIFAIIFYYSMNSGMRWCSCRKSRVRFPIFHNLSPSCCNIGPGVEPTFNRHEYQEYLLCRKGSRCVGLTTLVSSADCLEILGPSNSCSPQGLSRPL
jgi:hypothetical protein